ncbi:MAG: ATP-dependent zinc metalloprotease FtsH [Chloroflexi bacterium]|nr:ATP-dependent zinc metalloprotease FtsH [Chloroflexota bacterium]
MNWGGCSLMMNGLYLLELLDPGYYAQPAATDSRPWNILIYFLPVLLIIVMIYLFMSSGRGAQDARNEAAKFGRSRARLITPNRPSVSFGDVAGVEEVKDDLREVVEFLKDRSRFQAIGATIPKGMLLVGPPGTGKTLLARAVAGEAGVPFYSVNGSEFVEMFVGVGAARVRDLFEQAKRNAPCIIFIDEIDAVGRVRSSGGPGSHEEREQTLNQILVEMDGFTTNSGVVVLAATNRADILDPALLRPGRFDRRVVLNLPDTHGRKAILEVHAKGKRLDSSIDFGAVAKETHGFSGADLAALMNEAAILAVRRNKTSIGMAELEESIDRILAGPERRSLKISPRDKELTAYHEAGHALVAHILPNVDPVSKISIVARGTMGGYTRILAEDRYFMTASKFKETLATLLAGHAAEELVFKEISTGPHSDMKQATSIARRMVTDYGMSEKLGLRTYGSEGVSGYPAGTAEQRDYSEEIARQIDEEVYTIVKQAYEISKRIITENRDRLTHIARRLLDLETLSGPELNAAFNEPISKPPADPKGAPARSG